MHAPELGQVGGLAGRRRALPFQTALLYQVHAEGADKESRVALALGDIPGQLRRVHRLLRGHVSERAPVVAHGQQHHPQHSQAHAEKAQAAAHFEFVQHVLCKGHSYSSSRWC